ncbi:CRISPR-associated RAMP protein, Csm3 family [Desulfotomaculum nigrificans CO-1-SRB]|uniref:CRISPR system Cms endoribonuclease Csm3 n=1 Tax=Desulfotomaculum nigrificans (strain DSM 14880 / VKM B-2319 / CO-1-SRB) TaxID=868595 RepID=F6B7U2_DESCC|nr:type III-A CRISPR-associated RAMP protein Csm3 [Desulfotomaculum nigrificans]AEF93464.1 CRISPR-associated RAMP protein, Csm3 family [Desulfotomaculum nigrificans CO-1-SRB]
MELTKYMVIKGIILCETGLRIGGSKDDIEIGGNDNPIIRYPLTGLPYVPGSSLKGKMRALLELKYSLKTQRSGDPCTCGNCLVCKVFGTHKAAESRLGPTRIIVRDAFLSPKSVNEFKAANQDKGIFYSEVKYENMVDRNTGKAGHPRPNERVPAGTEFAFEIVLRIFKEDNEKDMLDFVKEGLQLVEKDYLGACGSRGYGKVRFINITLDNEPFDL